MDVSTRLRCICLLMLCCSMMMAQKPQRFHKTLPAGNYSGITHLGGDRYARGVKGLLALTILPFTRK